MDVLDGGGKQMFKVQRLFDRHIFKKYGLKCKAKS
jgi:hypothetical protein